MANFFSYLFGGSDDKKDINNQDFKPKTKADFSIDCKNLNCPMPIVNISRKIKEMSINQTLEITATDPAFKADLEAWVRKTGNSITSFTSEDKLQTAIVKKLV